MRITVRFFAQLRESFGSDRWEVELEEGATLGSLRRVLAARAPELAEELCRYPAVVDGEVAPAERSLRDGQEVAWLPPVAGGFGGAVVAAALTRERIDPGELAQTVSHPGAGAVALFLGIVRDHEGKRRVERLEYEAYESVAGRRLRAVAEEALARWPEARIAVVHRVGTLAIGETSVGVAVATPHRAEAFACGRFLIDRVKSGVPIWKKSHGPGGAVWVEGEHYRERGDD